MDIVVSVEGVILNGTLHDTPCAKQIVEQLPARGEINTWGNEYYFEVDINLGPDETATKDVEVGDLAYWPQGNAIALFFGPTPESSGDEPVPASKVNIIGKVDNAEYLKQLDGKGEIVIDKKPD